MPYLYESHMGGYYTSYCELDWEETHCETCGDSDTLIDYFETEEDIEEYLKQNNL